MVSGFVIVGLVTLVLTCIRILIKHHARPSLSKIRGPKSSSFILGNLLELFQSPAGQTDIKWQHLYGNVIRFKALFGEDQLLVADPKALQRIFHTSAYSYLKEPSFRTICRMLMGKGIGWAEGEDHERQRKVLLPGFGSPESKAFLDVFRGCSESMCLKWTEIIGNNGNQTTVIDVSRWFSCGTLDVIGQAAFDVQFGALDESTHPLTGVYKNMLKDVLGSPSAQQIFMESASKYIPTWILQWMIEYGHDHRLQRARQVKKVVTEIAKQLVHDKAESLLASKGSHDIFTLLIKANMDTDAKNRLTEEELLSQMCAILLAGHETTSNTMCWILFELARHPDMQSRLRDEIRRTEAAIRARGDTQFTAADFDTMPYAIAVIKEGLRLHPVATRSKRIADKDDILPLSRPIITELGASIDHIVVPKGTRVVASTTAYNRIEELWGKDPHEFNPDRWLDGIANEKKPFPVGIYANLMTFIGGARACIGFRFALLEIQTFLVDTMGRFAFSMTERSERVRPAAADLLIPVVEGELDRGAQLPLAVAMARHE